MAFPTTISSGHLTSLAVYTGATITDPLSVTTEAGFTAAFAATADFIEIPFIRDFPEFGTPANIVNVPVYNQATSAQIQAQADAPTLEFNLNYVPSLFAAGTTLGDLIGGCSGAQLFQIGLTNCETPDVSSVTAGLGAAENSVWYFHGRMEALNYMPSTSDAFTAKLTLSMPTGVLYGAYTID